MSRSAIEPEVCLAVCITPPDRTAVLNLSRKAYLAHEGADNVDEFISTCGFEYIDGTSDARAKDSGEPLFPDSLIIGNGWTIEPLPQIYPLFLASSML